MWASARFNTINNVLCTLYTQNIHIMSTFAQTATLRRVKGLNVPKHIIGRSVCLIDPTSPRMLTLEVLSISVNQDSPVATSWAMATAAAAAV